MANLKNLTIDDTGFLQLPRGTSGQRPSSPQNGYMRFNTTSQCAETFTNGKWVPLGGFPYISGQPASNFGWTSGPSDVKGESNALPGGCQNGLTFEQALNFVHSNGARLPTIDEIIATAAVGTGCLFNNERIWTANTDHFGGDNHYVIFGDTLDNGKSILLRANSDTANVRYVADVDTNRNDPVILYDIYSCIIFYMVKLWQILKIL